MAITDIATSGDTTGATDLAAVRAAHTAGNDVRLGNGTYYFPPDSVPTSSHNGYTMYLSDSTVIQGVYSSGDEGETMRAGLNTSSASGYSVLWESSDPSAVDASTGPLIVANDIYHAFLGGDDATINGVRLTDAAFKCGQTRGSGDHVFRNLYCESTRGTSTNTEYNASTNPSVRYPVALQFDRNVSLFGSTGTSVLIENIKCGAFANSGTTGGGPGIKIAGYDTVTIRNFKQLFDLDRWSGFSLNLAENIGNVFCENSDFRGGVTFTPEFDPTSSYADVIVDTLSFDGCVIGCGREFAAGQVNLDAINRIRCASLSLANTTVSGFRRTAFDFSVLETGTYSGEYAADYLTSLYLQDVIFETFLTDSTTTAFGEPAVLRINASAESISGKVSMAGTVSRLGPNTGGMRWSDNSTANTVLTTAAAAATTGTLADQRAAKLTSIGVTSQWNIAATNPRDDADTVSDLVGSTDLTVEAD